MKYDIDYRMFEEQFDACTFNINFYSSFSRKISKNLFKQRTFKTGNFDFKFQISINKNWKRNHDRRNGREYFQFNVSSISPLVDASSNRTHFHSCLSFNRAFHDRATETRRAREVRVVHVSFTSIIWRSVRLRESTIASNHAPIAIPMEKQLTSVDRVRFINRGKLYTRSLKRKYGEIISRRHRCRINNSPTRVSNVSGKNCNR